MLRDDLLLRTRLIPPWPYRRVLARPGLLAHLGEALDYRLTVVQAGTGYGKTTALAALGTDAQPLIWYTLDSRTATHSNSSPISSQPSACTCRTWPMRRWLCWVSWATAMLWRRRR